MDLRYLDTTQAGLAWMRRYYREQPQLNAGMAVTSLKRAEAVLLDNPFAGSAFEDSTRVRVYPLRSTVFSLLYTVAHDTIWIIDIHDQRGFRNADALRAFSAELRARRAR